MNNVRDQVQIDRLVTQARMLTAGVQQHQLSLRLALGQGGVQVGQFDERGAIVQVCVGGAKIRFQLPRSTIRNRVAGEGKEDAIFLFEPGQ